jgi:hypothetical protein
VHYILYKGIGMEYRGSRIVYEERLLPAPGICIPRLVLRLEGVNMETSDALCAFLKFRLRVPAITMFADGFIVFRAKFGLKFLRPRPVHVHPQRYANRQNNRHDQDQHHRIEVG